MLWCTGGGAQPRCGFALSSLAVGLVSGAMVCQASPVSTPCSAAERCHLQVDVQELRENFRVRTRESTRYYEVTGDTSREIWQQLRGSMNPLSELPAVGRKPFGNASLAYKYSYQPGVDAGFSLCRIVSGEIEVRLEIVLPRLRGLQDKPETLQRKWHSFQSTIIEHEAGHLEILRGMAVLLPSALSRVDAKSCDELDRKIRSTVHQIESAIERDSLDYDHLPGHEVAMGW